MNMKGIVLAGGSGSRLHPITYGVSKHLIPIYDKPMIYYSLSVLLLAQIRDILLITTPEDYHNYKRLLGDGSQFGIHLSYAIQPTPGGLSQAFLIGEEFLQNSRVCLVLGDNIFYGIGFRPRLLEAVERSAYCATIFGYQVKDPERFGVVTFDEKMRAVALEEKPQFPTSNYAVTGLYFYDDNVVQLAKQIKPSLRGELEITCLNKMYLEMNKLYVERLGRGFAWLDTGTHESLLDAAHFVATVEKRQGYKIACLEEIAFRNGWLSVDALKEIAGKLKKTSYGHYLYSLIEENHELSSVARVSED